MPHGQGGAPTAEQEIARANALVKSSKRERQLTAEAFGLYQPETLLAMPDEVAPEGWHEEADLQGLWKMFRG